MEINRSNYEIWFIDWLDGSLNSSQIKALFLFLEKNPDLREEFNDLTPVELISPGSSFPCKEQLKRSASDIAQSQFEYLCAAFLENDLNNDQQEELTDLVNTDPERKKTFVLIQKSRLTPISIRYKHKNLLLKRTSIQKAIRLSAAVSGAAAAISLIIILYSVLHGISSLRSDSSSQKFVSESPVQNASPAIKPGHVKTDSIQLPSVKTLADGFTGHDKREAIPRPNEIIKTQLKDTLAVESGIKEIHINKIAVHDNVKLQEETGSNSLVASTVSFNAPEVKEERMKPGKFIAKTFREKILKEKKTDDTPIQGFDIAEAGVKGLNKLLGWEMALERKNDETGQPKSIYFRSKILTVNAPVKKRELQP